MPQDESTLYKAAKETLVEYFQKTSLNGFGLLYNIRRRKYQRVLWFMFILMGITFAIYVVLFTLVYFLRAPTVIVLSAQDQPIWKIPFPAVALCSSNKLSRRAVTAYAQEISRLSFGNETSDYWLKKLKLFAGFFESGAIDFDEAIEFQKKLDALYLGSYNVSEVLMKLSPPCNELLIKCYWAGRLKECNEILKLHATAAGNCCIFNYQRENKDDVPLFYPNDTGADMGLTLLLNTSKADYFYTDRSTGSFRLQLFDAYNLPDAATGGLRELSISNGEDVEVALSIVQQITTIEARAYAVQKRHCYFAEEHGMSYDLSYSQAECLSGCKMHSALTICGCLPYYAPANFIEWYKSTGQEVCYCTLEHVECLERYHVTWNTFRPLEQVESISTDLKQELQDSVTCYNCLPLCSYNHYYYRKRVSSLDGSRFLAQNKKFMANSSFSNETSMVKVYFATSHVTQFRKNVLYNWYQILSNIGGVIGICMGCSLISGFEIIYFASFRLFENFQRLRKTALNIK